MNLDYYCTQCSTAVCCECKIFGSHKPHEISSINSVYEEKINNLQNMLSEFRTTISEKDDQVKTLQSILNQLKKHREQQRAELDD